MKIGRYLVGLISGATFGVLFAPKKGKKLRDELYKKGGESGQDALSALIAAFKDAGSEAVEEARRLAENEQLDAAIGASKEKMRDYLSQLEDTGYDIAARAQEQLEEFSTMAATTATKGASRARKAVKRTKTTAKKQVKATKKRATAAKKTVAKKTVVKKAKPVKKAVKKAAPKKSAKKSTSTKKTTAKKPAAKRSKTGTRKASKKK